MSKKSEKELLTQFARNVAEAYDLDDKERFVKDMNFIATGEIRSDADDVIVLNKPTTEGYGFKRKGEL